MNVFYDVIAPEIRTPRDLIRLANALAVTWSAVGAEVDRADFIAMEALRLLRGNVYRALRAHKDRLCGKGDRLGRSERDQGATMDTLLFGSVDHKDRDRLRRALMRLFPRLESVWSNMLYGDSSAAEWAEQRRVCSLDHFDAYFRFVLGEDVLPRSEVNTLIARASDQEFINETLRQAVGIKRRNGKSKAALIFDELNMHAVGVADDDVAPLLKAIFAVGDEVDIETDKAGAFNIGDNHLRIHWLLRRLTSERFDLARRSAMLVAACEGAALGWLIDFTSSAYEDYHPREGKGSEAEANCLTTAMDAESLRDMALSRLRSSAASGELSRAKRLPYLLFRWRDLAADDGAEVKAWADAQMDNDAMIVVFAKAFTTYSWSQALGLGGLGDVVAKRRTDAAVDGLDNILDKGKLRRRVEELATRGGLAEDADTIRTFLNAWIAHDRERARGAASSD
jgi:predicted KAP-like P-loop ATPase